MAEIKKAAAHIEEAHDNQRRLASSWLEICIVEREEMGSLNTTYATDEAATCQKGADHLEMVLKRREDNL